MYGPTFGSSPSFGIGGVSRITPRQQPKKARRKIPEMGGARRLGGRVIGKLQALVYDILPPTSAIVDYAIGLGKLTSNFSLMLVDA